MRCLVRRLTKIIVDFAVWKSLKISNKWISAENQNRVITADFKSYSNYFKSGFQIISFETWSLQSTYLSTDLYFRCFGRSTWHCICLHSVRGICAVMLVINEWVLFLYDIVALYRAVQCCRRFFSACVQISSVFFHSCSFLLHNSLLSISVQPAYEEVLKIVQNSNQPDQKCYLRCLIRNVIKFPVDVSRIR